MVICVTYSVGKHELPNENFAPSVLSKYLREVPFSNKSILMYNFVIDYCHLCPIILEIGRIIINVTANEHCKIKRRTNNLFTI